MNSERRRCTVHIFNIGNWQQHETLKAENEDGIEITSNFWEIHDFFYGWKNVNVKMGMKKTDFTEEWAKRRWK